MPVVEIEILGRRYALQSDRDPAHVQSVAAFVDEQLRQVGNSSPSGVTREDAILVALNIASELALVKQKSEDLAQSLDRRLAGHFDRPHRGVPRRGDDSSALTSGSEVS